MLRRRKPLPVWEPYDWNSNDEKQIDSKLNVAREEINNLLEIDPDAMQTRVLPAREKRRNDRGDDANTRLKALQYREPSTEGELVSDADLALEELCVACLRCCADLINEKALASAPRIRKILEDIVTRPSITEEEIAALDPRVREIIAKNYPVNRKFFAQGLVQSDHVIAGTRDALERFGKSGPGRPSGGSRTADSFAWELRNLFENWGARTATRSVALKAADNPQGEAHKEGGTFHRFCEIVLDAMPEWARSNLIRRGGSIDYFVRRATQGLPQRTRDQLI